MITNLIVILSLALLSILLYFDNTLIKVSNYKIKNEKIPKEFNNFKIVHLSDLHNYGFKNYYIKLIEKINNENPSIIVMTGDMVNKYDKNFENFLHLAEALSKKYEIYYIVGNHEIRLKKDDLNFIINKLKEFGIKILSNEKVTIMRKKDYINIYGIDVPLSYDKTINKPSNIKKVISGILNKCNEKEYNILLAHNPLYFEAYSKHNVDLTLSLSKP